MKTQYERNMNKLTSRSYDMWLDSEDEEYYDGVNKEDPDFDYLQIDEMSKRYGRNQKRRHKEEIERLSKY